MKQRRLKQWLAIGTLSLGFPVAMSASVSGGDEDNDVFAASHLASRYEMFVGSRQNAQNLITGLRHGSKIRLAANDGSSAIGSIMFTPPTPPMNYGEIDRVLSLAQAQLANRDVTSPTPEMLHIALMGGSFTDGGKTVGTTGVLPLRSQGLGWGQIAQALSLDTGNASNASFSYAGQVHHDNGSPERAGGDSRFVATASGAYGGLVIDH